MLTFLALQCAGFAQGRSDAQPGKLGHLLVLRVANVNDDDGSAKVSDYLGAKLRVRFRYQAPEDKNVYLYAPPACPPEGYVLDKTKGDTFWLAATPQKRHRESPGFAVLRSQLGEGWVYMPKRSAIEWDVDMEEPPSGVQRARSVFVSEDRGKTAWEIVSSWLTGDSKW
jgi:hypothetical protein